MYVLTRIGISGNRMPLMVSKNKKRLEDHIKKDGYYFSKNIGQYINDKNVDLLKDTDVCDYLIQSIEELK